MGALTLLAARLAERLAAALGIPVAGVALLAGLALGAGPTGYLAWRMGQARLAIEARTEVNRLARDLAEARLDASTARATAESARAAEARASAAQTAAENRNQVYARDLARRGPLGACGLSDADRARLLDNAWVRQPGAGRAASPARR